MDGRIDEKRYSDREQRGRELAEELKRVTGWRKKCEKVRERGDMSALNVNQREDAKRLGGSKRKGGWRRRGLE